MSFILDALRKSENQRRLGQAPTLADTGALSTAPAQYTTRTRWPWLVGLAALTAAMLWYWLPTGTGDRQPPVSNRPDTTPSIAAGESETKPRVQLSNPEPTRSVVENYRPTEPATDDAATPEDQARVLTDSRSEPGDESEPETELAAAPRPSADSLQPVLVAPPMPEPEAPGRRPLNFFELPASIRSEIGELKVTMQVYATDPVGRFAIINRRRVVEKQELQPGLEVDEIRRQGVVFQYRDYRFIIGD